MPKKPKLKSPLVEFIQNTEMSIIKNAEILKAQLNLYSLTYRVNCECANYDYSKLFFKWAIEFYENFELMLQGNKQFDQKNPEELYLLSDESLILKSINLNSLKENQLWEPVILPNFALSAMKDSEFNRENIIRTIIELNGGYFNESKIMDQITCESVSFRAIKVKGLSNPDKWIVFSIEINRFPVLVKGILDEFICIQLVKIIDLADTYSKSLKIASAYLQEIKGVPELWVPKWMRFWKSASYVKQYKTIPATFIAFKLCPIERSRYRYIPEIKRWRKGQKQKVWSISGKGANSTIQENNQIINQLASQESCLQFIKMMEKITSFKFRLSDEEKAIISESSNQLAIGRSGTGKTTSLILRMFAAEMVFKKKSKIHLHNSGMLETSNLTTDDVRKKVNLHQVFITVSPVLVFEVKRLYDNLHRQLEAAIRREVFNAAAEELNDHFFDPNEDSDINLPNSLLNFEDEHFPFFIPIFNFLTRVDASLEIPFFAVGVENNEENIAYHLIKRGMKVRNLYTPNGFVKVPTFEIDFDYFSYHFWPKLRSLIGISPITIWSEICSVIKGSPEAYKDRDGHIQKETYINLGKKQSQIDIDKRKKIWDIFVQYEDWKKRQNAYDFQDLVNYVLKTIDNEGYKGSPIHFTFIDEVQDCSNNFLLLILKLTEQKLLFVGDTAQSITRGVGFRFCDLNSLFLEASVMNHSQPVIKHLSVNFRSHTEILEVAHIVVQLIVTFFPDFIDRLNKETSTIHGAKPIIVNSNSINMLKLCIQRVSQRTTDIEFGWNQVVLVRTDKARKNLPNMLKEAICLTILESKGLEFDDVILYNFFNDSQVEENEWARLSKFIDSDINEIKKAREGMKNSLLCSELKHLYVGITRARKKLIIFDEDGTCRESLQKCWMTNQLIDLFDFNIEIQNEMIEPQNENFDWNNQETWRRLGYQLFNRKNYGQAKFCWHKAGDEILIKKIDATISAEEGKKLFSEIAAVKEEAKETGRRLKNAEKDEISRNKKKAMGQFRNAAKLFESASEFKEAAMCYSSLEDYKNAAKLFLKANMIHEAAVAYYKAKCYIKAAYLYERSQDYVMHVKCYVLANNCDQALTSLEKYILGIPDNDAKLLLQSIIRCRLSCYFPEPFVDNNKDGHEYRDFDDIFVFPGLKFKNYWATYRSGDEFGELSEEFFSKNRNLSANNKLDPKNTILILKYIAKTLEKFVKNTRGSRILYNTETIDFIKDCQKIPDIFNKFSDEFALNDLAPLSFLLDSFINYNKRICILIANSLRLADLSCWYFLSSVFKLSKPFLSCNNYRKDAFSYFKYRSIYTGFIFIDPSFYSRGILSFGLAISGFWKLLWFIPENACKDLINLYFLGRKEYNKLQEKNYFIELKEIKHFEQVIAFANSDNHMTINGNFDGFRLENDDDYYWMREVHRLNDHNNEELNDLRFWFRNLLIGDHNVINNDIIHEDPKVSMENWAGICFLLVGSNQMLHQIKLFLQIDEMEALMVIADNIIKLLLEKPNGIETQKRSKILEYFLLAFGIKLIIPGKCTKWLPFLTHVVMSKYYIRSEIILNKSDKSTYSFDIEGDYWLVPKALIFKDIAKLILHSLNELIYERIKLANLKNYPFNTIERPSARVLEHKICILGEISMVNDIKALCNSCGINYKSGIWGEIYNDYAKKIKCYICWLPFSYINLTSASRKAIKDEAIKTLSSLYKMHTIFSILKVSYLLLLLVGEEHIFMDLLNKVLLKKIFSDEKISYIHKMTKNILKFVSCANEGYPESTCHSIWKILSKNLKNIHFVEASSLFQIYCAHALLACPKKLIPAKLVKPYYDCYSISIYNNLQNYINYDQIDSNISLINNMIELFKDIWLLNEKFCLDNNKNKEKLKEMFIQCLTVIMNSKNSEENFQKLISLGFIPEDFIYESERLNKIFQCQNFSINSLRYIYKYEDEENNRISNILIDRYFTGKIGEDLLEVYDIKDIHNINYSVFETLPRANFSKFLEFSQVIEDIYENVSSGYLLLLSNRRQREIPDLDIMRAIITLMNNCSETVSRIYEYSLTEEQYNDIILGYIKDQVINWILSDENIENWQVLSKRIKNKDENDQIESEDEDSLYNKNEKIKVNLKDPLDEVKFNEKKLILREKIEEGFEFFSTETETEIDPYFMNFK